MPPRGRGRGRGGGRWANRATTRGGSRVAGTTPRLNRTKRAPFGHVNGQLHDQITADSVHAIFEPPGLLIIAGLLPEHFPDFDSEGDHSDDSDSHSDYGSATAKTPRKLTARERLQEAEHASNPGNDDDWTETEVEVFVAPKTRGFYRPPPKREVVRKRVKRAESSRYSDVASTLRHVDDAEDDDYDDVPSRRSSQKSSVKNADLPVIVEQEATDGDDADDADVNEEMIAVAERSGGEARKSRKDVAPALRSERAIAVDEGELSDSNFPHPFLKKPPTPPVEKCEDQADWIMQKRFAPMGDPQAFITALTKLDPSTRSTDVLFNLALNAQRAIRAWQDEYLQLDMITAPKSNPPKKPLTGGRTTIDPLVYDDMLEADLYGYNFDVKKAPGMQDPFRQRAGGGKFIGGRELRQRRGRDVGAIDLSEAEATDTGGYGTRRRRAAQRQANQLEVPPRGVKRVSSTGASEYDLPPRKRGRPSAAEKNLMQARVRQLREESAAVSTSSERDGRSSEPPRRRGRPPGSKNTMPRSDAGIKKGPRKPRVASGQADSENTSLDRSETAAPVSEDDSVMADDTPQAVGLNGTQVHDAGQPNHAVANGEPASSSMEWVRTSASTPGSDRPALKDKDPKKRVRSEKRSKSMTEWWAARKAKAAEDRKQQLAQQAEQDRLAEEQARAAHAAHQAQFAPQDVRFWPQIAPQHSQHASPAPYPAPISQPGPPTFTTRPQLQPQGPQQKPLEHLSLPLPPPPSHTQPQLLHMDSTPASLPNHDAQQIIPPLPAGHPQGLPAQGPPPPPPQQQQIPQRLLHPGAVPDPQQITQQPHSHRSSHVSQLGSPLGPSPVLHPSQTRIQPLHHPPSIPFASAPPRSPTQHAFHSHPAPPPPPSSVQYSPPNLPPTSNRRPSPLRRIDNYVSDPSKAAQPAGPPYQTIMTPGAGSPTATNNHGHSNRPDSRGRTPPTSAGGFMGAFPVNNHATRPPIPGTGSFRPDTPGKSTFATYSTPLLPRQQGRMTGAQVQDLALAAVQPVQRKPLEDVLKEQREWRGREPSPQLPSSGPRSLYKLQPAPLDGPNALHQPHRASISDSGSAAMFSQINQQQHHDRGPSVPLHIAAQPPPPAAFSSHPGSAMERRSSLDPSIKAIISHNLLSQRAVSVSSPAAAPRPQLPPLMASRERGHLEDNTVPAVGGAFGGAADGGRHRSISMSSQGPPPLRFLELQGDGRRGGSTGPASSGYLGDSR